MKKLLLCFFIMNTTWVVHAQQIFNVIGKYKKIDQRLLRLHETIVLNADSSFEYERRIERELHQLKGQWKLDYAGYLILNSNNKDEKTVEVSEAFKSSVPSDSLKIRVTYFDEENLYYHLIVNEGQANEMKIKNDEQYAEEVDELTIARKGVYSLTFYCDVKLDAYFIKNCRTNYLDFKINPIRSMRNEKWLIVNQQIIPKGIFGEYMNYSLVKESAGYVQSEERSVEPIVLIGGNSQNENTNSQGLYDRNVIEALVQFFKTKVMKGP